MNSSPEINRIITTYKENTMSTFIEEITLRVCLESNVPEHVDLYNTYSQAFYSLPGVKLVNKDGSDWLITTTYGTYTSYMPEEYMRIIDNTRKSLEDLNKNYTENKNMYDVL